MERRKKDAKECEREFDDIKLRTVWQKEEDIFNKNKIKLG